MYFVHVALLIQMVQCFDLKFKILSFDMVLETPKREFKFRSSITNETNVKNSSSSVNTNNLRNRTLTMNTTNAQRSLSKKNEITAKNSSIATNASEVQYDKLNVTSGITYRNEDVNCTSPELENKQIQAVLSDMRNQLTLVFTKVNLFITKEITKVSRKFLNTDLIRRALQSRFKISYQKRSTIFDEIFYNMSQNYRNSTASRVFRTDQDDCRDVENRRLWELLEYSLLNLKNAMRRYLSDFLKEQAISAQSALGKKVSDLLTTEISQIRSNQLNMLCEQFQLCNGTVLHDFMWHV